MERPVLVTGFGPFPGQPANPTEAMVDEFAGDERVVGHVLPVVWDEAVATVLQLVDMVDPSAVLLLGLSGGATTVRLETTGWNEDRSEVPDTAGELRTGGAIHPGGPPSLPSRLPTEALRVALFRAGVPVAVSDDPGRYVCNHLLHEVLRRTPPSLPVGFVHVPPPSAPGFTDDMLLRAAHVLVDALAATASAAG